jgi:ankyrin repeat protein
MGFMISVLILFLTVGCGQHQSRRKTFNVAGQDQTTQIVQDPKVLMQMAIADNRVQDFFKLLRENQYSVNLVLPSGRELLGEAVFLKRVKIIRGLRILGADDQNLYLEGQNLRDWVELQSDKNKILRALDKKEKDDNQDLTDALVTLSFQNIKSLLEEGIDPNFIMADGETPLPWSIQNKSMNAIRALFLSFDLNVNFLNQNGISALTLAKQLQLRSVVAELQRRGAVEKEGNL